MRSFSESVGEYRKQLAGGAIREAYRGLMEYMMALRTHFKNRYPDLNVSGGIYYGYMDMTYFSVFPQSLKDQGLKVAIVFIHDACRFEVWLAGYNKQVQSKYWKLFGESGWNKYHLVSSTQGADSIVEHVLAGDPDFDDLAALTMKIESGALEFIRDVEGFLSGCASLP